MKKTLFILCLSLLCYSSLIAQIPSGKPKGNAKGQQLKSNYTAAIFQNSDKTFGYDIFDNDKKLIHQPSIPGRFGNVGFKTKQDAEKVANIAISKIKSGIMPPTIEEKELKKMGI